MSDLTLDELTRFGITLEDEHPHPYSPDYEWWNESVFYDWYDRAGSNAGHCRIGWHPNQHRVWVWLFLYNGAEWVAIEEPRLPFSSLKLPRIAYDDGWGLRFSYTVREELRSGRLEVAGFGRVISGPRTGMILPVSVELDVETVGAAHSLGQHTLAGHSATDYSTSRFEQPIRARGRYAIGGESRELDVRGERDHSWGPRWWNIEWSFVVVNGDDYRLQCAVVRVPEAAQISTGYLHRTHTQTVTDVQLDLDFHGPFAATLSLKDAGADSGEVTGNYLFKAPWDPIEQAALVALAAKWQQDLAVIRIVFTITPKMFRPCGESCFTLGIEVTAEKRTGKSKLKKLFSQFCAPVGKANLFIDKPARAFVLKDVKIETHCKGAVGWFLNFLTPFLTKTYGDMKIFQMPPDLPLTVESVRGGAHLVEIAGSIDYTAGQPKPEVPPKPQPVDVKPGQ